MRKTETGNKQCKRNRSYNPQGSHRSGSNPYFQPARGENFIIHGTSDSTQKDVPSYWGRISPILRLSGPYTLKNLKSNLEIIELFPCNLHILIRITYTNTRITHESYVDAGYGLVMCFLFHKNVYSYLNATGNQKFYYLKLCLTFYHIFSA